MSVLLRSSLARRFAPRRLALPRVAARPLSTARVTPRVSFVPSASAAVPRRSFVSSASSASATPAAGGASGAVSDTGLVPVNKLKAVLSRGELSVGFMLAEIRQPSIMALAANGGYQFALIDGEHGAFGIETISELCRAARAAGLTPIVRVPECTYAWCAPVLDAGAQGLMLPRIQTAEQVRQVVEWCKFPPVGTRGNALARSYVDFKGHANVAQVMREANAQTMIVVQIETKQAIENIAAIVAVPGVDAALIGPNDLSIALGVPGQQSHPIVEAAILKTFAACKAQGTVAPAVHMNALDAAVYWAQRGATMVSYNSEIGLMVSAAAAGTAAIKKAVAPKP